MDAQDAPPDATAAEAGPALDHPRAAQLVIGATQEPWVVNVYTLALAGGLLVATPPGTPPPT